METLYPGTWDSVPPSPSRCATSMEVERAVWAGSITQSRRADALPAVVTGVFHIMKIGWNHKEKLPVMAF